MESLNDGKGTERVDTEAANIRTRRRRSSERGHAVAGRGTYTGRRGMPGGRVVLVCDGATIVRRGLEQGKECAQTEVKQNIAPNEHDTRRLFLRQRAEETDDSATSGRPRTRG